METPIVLEIDQTSEIEPNPLGLEMSVGRSKNSDDEIQKHDHADEEIGREEEVSTVAFRIHNLEREIA